MQNPPPGQQGYGTPYTPPPPDTVEKSSIGIETNLAAALSYIWIVGLVFFFMEKTSRFIRFHAMQSVLYGILWMVVMFVFVMISIVLAVGAAAAAGAAGDAAGGIAGLLVSLISLGIWLILPLLYFGGLILAAVRAYQGKMFKLPVIGNIADRIATR